MHIKRNHSVVHNVSQLGSNGSFHPGTWLIVNYTASNKRTLQTVSMFKYTHVDLFYLLQTIKRFYLFKPTGEDYWRWQTLNPDGYRMEIQNGTNV